MELYADFTVFFGLFRTFLNNRNIFKESYSNLNRSKTFPCHGHVSSRVTTKFNLCSQGTETEKKREKEEFKS